MVNPPVSPPPPKLLIVEGVDDKHVVQHLRHVDQEIPPFCISEKEGLTQLLAAIGLELRVENRRALGILVDANDDVQARWNAVTDRLQKEKMVTLPASPDAAGTIVNFSDRTRVGIWLMPDNKSRGELEDFVVCMIPDDDPVWPRSESYIDDIPQGDRKFTHSKTVRAKVHAWLATRQEPRKMGAAIRTGDLHVHRTLCQQFVGWLSDLFA